MDQLPRLGKRELICLPLFTCNYVVSVCRGNFLFLRVLGMGYVILFLWHSLSLPYNYFEIIVFVPETNRNNVVVQDCLRSVYI